MGTWHQSQADNIFLVLNLLCVSVHDGSSDGYNYEDLTAHDVRKNIYATLLAKNNRSRKIGVNIISEYLLVLVFQVDLGIMKQ